MTTISAPVAAAAYLYPWDVVGDACAPERLLSLGIREVTLAAVYHATRALTPRHPTHRIVLAERTAAYVPVDPSRWRDAPIRLHAADDSFEIAATMLRNNGIAVHAWIVVCHVDLPGWDGRYAVVNAYGDRYPWALCPSNDDVVSYATMLADEVADRDGLDGVELEACGWYGVDHLCAHDKVALPGSDVLRYLLSLCFCVACGKAYAAAGVDGERLRRAVCVATDAVLRDPATNADTVLADADVIATVRRSAADRLRLSMIARLRTRRPEWRVALHASPDPLGTTAFTGVDPVSAGAVADLLVAGCWADRRSVGPSLAAGVPVHANVLAVTGLGGGTYALMERAAAAVDAGATGLRFYHAGLASDLDLAAIRAVVERWCGPGHGP